MEITLTDEQKELIESNKWDEDAVMAYIELGISDDDLRNFEETYQGQWNSDEDFVMQLVEDIGDLPKDLPAYIHIDWESTARDIMMDYSAQDGFYFRNI